MVVFVLGVWCFECIDKWFVEVFERYIFVVGNVVLCFREEDQESNEDNYIQDEKKLEDVFEFLCVVQGVFNDWFDCLVCYIM